MKKDNLTKQKKKSIIKASSVRSFDRVFIKVKAKMKTLYKDNTDWWVRRKVRQTLCFFDSFLRRTVMKNMSKTTRGRFATALTLSVIALAALTACGGGGGSTPAPTPTPITVTCWNGSTTSAVSNCPVVNPAPTLALGTDNLPKITVAPGATVTGGTVTATAGTSTVVYAVQPNGTVTLTSGSQALLTMHQYTAVINYSNGPSSSIAGTYTTGVAYYNEINLVVFADQGGYLGRITYDANGLPNGSVPLTNNTGYTLASTGSATPLALCGYYDKLLPTGQPFARCNTTGLAGNLLRNFPVNPITGTLEAEWTGAVPAGAVVHDVFYGSTSGTVYANHNIYSLGDYILPDVGGVIFFDETARTKLRYLKPADMTNTDWNTASTVISTGDFKYLVRFSNKKQP